MIGNVKHGNFDRILGFLYIAAQFAGAFIGALFATMFANGEDNSPIPLHVANEDTIQTILLEVCGSFFLVFMYLTSTDTDTKFS